MSILGMGHPLLDILAEVEMSMLERYCLQPNNTILAEERHQPVYTEMAALPNVQYIAGGATQNSIRVAQWMLQLPESTAYMGCIGDDAFSRQMAEECAKDGVRTAYMVDASTPTGCCAVLLTGTERSLCTTLGAAHNFTTAYLKRPEVWQLVEAADIIYSSGFFITSCEDSMRLAAMEADRRGAVYCLNLAAPFIAQVPAFKKAVKELLPKVDILFGNETEAQAWADSEGWETGDV